ncbi:DapH/DapD/GlmU-related protein [Streptomyces sp. NBC_01275]|uniref:DapH/DapD/GlmU-related protein n=1 Tax=Streptomyces sp. NBC_01275 TaxID=2903807 RepID=UPI0022524585|nr:DapH/DapD/GlmU-related protein [Streptomyces sp. NBC_01275]MCX4766865.1 DapH/DapD/GlmU-related protein [Streptomyces sp. NBC_01275]
MTQTAVVQRSLRGFTGAGYDKGRPVWVQAAWFAALHLLFVKWWFPARWRPALLRAFGARVGQRVLIRRGVRIHWPWKLDVGDDVWIGEDAWILNLEPVTVGDDVCVSQNALLCTGSHRRRSVTFEFDNGPIRLAPGSWVAARATVLRGVTVGRGAVVGAGAVAHQDLAPGSVLTTGGASAAPPASFAPSASLKGATA